MLFNVCFMSCGIKVESLPECLYNTTKLHNKKFPLKFRIFCDIAPCYKILMFPASFFALSSHNKCLPAVSIGKI